MLLKEICNSRSLILRDGVNIAEASSGGEVYRVWMPSGIVDCTLGVGICDLRAWIDFCPAD